MMLELFRDLRSTQAWEHGRRMDPGLSELYRMTVHLFVYFDPSTKVTLVWLRYLLYISTIL